MSGSERAVGDGLVRWLACQGGRKPDGISKVLTDNYQLSVLYPSLRSSHVKVRVREARPRGTDLLSTREVPTGSDAQRQEVGQRVPGRGRGWGLVCDGDRASEGEEATFWR